MLLHCEQGHSVSTTRTSSNTGSLVGKACVAVGLLTAVLCCTYACTYH